MGAIWFRVRAELRARRRATIVLVLMVGVLGGAVLAIAAGARRTEAAYPAFRERTRAADVLFPAGGEFFGFARLDFDVVRSLPQVLDADQFMFGYSDVRKLGSTGPGSGHVVVVNAPGGVGDRINRMDVVAGRRPDPAEPLEVMMGYEGARRQSIRAGDRLDVTVFDRDTIASLGSGVVPSGGLRLELLVTGIGAASGELPPLGSRESPQLQVSQSFVETYGDELFLLPALLVRLRGGAEDVAAFQRAVEARAVVGERRPVEMHAWVEQGRLLQRSIHLQVIALSMLVALGGLTLVLVLAQAVTRQIHLEAPEYPLLRALGASTGDVFAIALARALVVAVAGAVVAVVVAWLLSPLMPIGIARILDEPGARFDAVTLPSGAGLLVVSLVLLVALPAWRAATVRASSQGIADLGARARPSVVAGLLARWSFSPSAVSGVRLALEPGHGRTAVPVRAALIGSALAVASLGAAVVFGSSLDHLTVTPRLYGWNWDARFGDTFVPDVGDQIEPLLRSHPAVGDASAGTFLPLLVNGRRSDGVAMDPVKGSVGVGILEGRPVASSGDVVLGTRTMRDVGARIGSTVTVSIGDRGVPLRVVGRAVFSDVGNLGGLGEGVSITHETLRRLAPEAPKNLFFVRWASGAGPAQIDEINRQLQRSVGDAVALPPQDLVNFGRVDNLPLILAGLLGALGLATLAHTLVTSVRRRRRDLAVLRTLGFVRRQVASTVAWQASILVVTALVLGVPVGIATGRWMWAAFARELGVPVEPILPLATVLIAAPLTVIAANLIALIPGMIAARLRPAEVLRAVQ